MDVTNNEPVFTQFDLHAGDFISDKYNKVCILNFEYIDILREFFASYTKDANFVGKVAQLLNWPYSANYYLMAVVLSARPPKLLAGGRTKLHDPI